VVAAAVGALLSRALSDDEGARRPDSTCAVILSALGKEVS